MHKKPTIALAAATTTAAFFAGACAPAVSSASLGAGSSLSGSSTLHLLPIVALPITVPSFIGSLVWGIHLRRVPF